MFNGYHTIDNPIPVFPDVGSIIVQPGVNRPCSSASSTMRKAMRSLTDPPGLKNSTFASEKIEKMTHDYISQNSSFEEENLKKILTKKLT